MNAYILKIQQDRSIAPSFNSFYEYMRDVYRKEMEERYIKVAKTDFNVKDNAELFPVVTIIIMEAFINKMRRLKGVRKQLIVEEAWKALSSANMADYLRYMYKTVRKYFGEAIVVTQEVDDIISSPIVKESIINNVQDGQKILRRGDCGDAGGGRHHLVAHREGKHHQ